LPRIQARSIDPPSRHRNHGLFVGPARQRLSALAARRYIVTDSVPRAEGLPLPLQVVGLSALLAEGVRRLHEDRSLGELRARG
jgi:phosphoribosylpyrophosphate synthetase